MVRSDQSGAELTYHRRIIHETRGSNIFGIDAAAAFAAAYPAQPVTLRHRLKSHRLLSLGALADLASHLDPGSLDRRHRAENDHANGSADLPVGEAIQTIQTNGASIALKSIETVPEYGRLMTELAEELALSVQGATGAMLHLQGVVVVASPDTFVPVHFDAEHWVTLQVTGTTCFTIVAGDAAAAPSAEAHERFQCGDRAPLAWDAAIDTGGTDLAIGPGEGVYIPPMAAHSVRNSTNPSIALSIGWHSHWSEAEADTRRANAVLRRFGLRPPPPPPWPRHARLRPALWRMLRTP